MSRIQAALEERRQQLRRRYQRIIQPSGGSQLLQLLERARPIERKIAGQSPRALRNRPVIGPALTPALARRTERLTRFTPTGSECQR